MIEFFLILSIIVNVAALILFIGATNMITSLQVKLEVKEKQVEGYRQRFGANDDGSEYLKFKNKN